MVASTTINFGKVMLGPSRIQSFSATAIPSSIRIPSKTALLGATRTVLGRKLTTRATADEEVKVDFDKVIADIGDKFEASDNKATIVAYSAAAVFALWVSEWLIHLPLLDFLLGFPIQLLGLATLPYLGVKYLVEKDGDITSDAGRAIKKVAKQLPGLDK